MKDKIKILTKKEIKLIKKKFKTLTFKNDFHLVYESQVPNTGIILIDGELNLSNKKKNQSIVIPGSMLGIYNLLKNEISKLGCIVKANSEVILIQKSDILDAISDKDSDLHNIIKENV